ncbi:MAG: 4-hydroxy-3-methylbut-2-enyl diphosphate reductase [Gemmatimonadetes bacterium]|nr:4-hydroxy-3-methylbut-2-enyl diphosphate reductase [Gemmatimonadota bacterium]
MELTYFRKGFGLTTAVQPLIDAEYHSAIVEQIRAQGYVATLGDMTVRLAQEFGFCYGVDRAIDYAYQTRHNFPDKRLFLVGEIIHNPFVNQRMREMGIEVLHPDDRGRFDFTGLAADDVVILPAFGVTLQDFGRLQQIGCVLVDTTCGSVLNVWRRVEAYARDGFTAVIHGKYKHEESRATASQVSKYANGRYLVVRHMAEARLVCDYIADRPGRMSDDQFCDHFREKSSAGFDPATDLKKIGVANQTTMLASESLAIAAELRKAVVERWGEEYAQECFRTFDTICSATQERQDAVLKMMEDPPDIMLVIGGYNSSNTNHLAHLCRQHTVAYHIEDATCIDPETGSIRHKPDLSKNTPERIEQNWLPRSPFQLGITAGASTPNNKIGDALVRILKIRGVDIATLFPATPGGLAG